ncbi:MAG: hypothetical protein ABSC50_09495 [Candidatus Bathyarchaeia archaeon]
MSQQPIKESDELLDSKRFGKTIVDLLQLSVGDTVQIMRDRLDRKRLMVICIPKSA